MTRAFRDTLLFTLGAIGFLHELIVQQTERPFVLTACLALMGLPLALGADRNKNGDQ